MKLVLQYLEETPDELIPGGIAGEVLLDDGCVDVLIDDDELRARLEELFSNPIQAKAGDPSGRTNITFSGSIPPATEEFFRRVGDILEGPKYRLLTRIEE